MMDASGGVRHRRLFLKVVAIILVAHIFSHKNNIFVKNYSCPQQILHGE